MSALRGLDLRPDRVVVLVVALVLNIGFYLPEAPSGVGGVSFPGIDKVFHLVVFALTVWAVGRVLAPERRFPMGWVAIAGVVHAVLIEVVQGALLPHRSMDGTDVLADSIGVALGVLAWWAERRVSRWASRSRRRTRPASRP